MDIRNEKKEGSTVDIWILRIFRLYHSFIVYTASFIYICIIYLTYNCNSYFSAIIEN